MKDAKDEKAAAIKEYREAVDIEAREIRDAGKNKFIRHLVETRRIRDIAEAERARKLAKKLRYGR